MESSHEVTFRVRAATLTRMESDTDSMHDRKRKAERSALVSMRRKDQPPVFTRAGTSCDQSGEYDVHKTSARYLYYCT